MTDENNSAKGNKELELKPIGAFCTDIRNSVKRIERHGDRALKHHSTYIEKVIEAYYRQLKIHKVTNSSIKTLVRNSNFWIPGDAFWGVVFEKPGKIARESLINAFTRVVIACAFGQVEAQKNALELDIEPLEIRGAMIAGQVLEKDLENIDSKLYNGSSLNVCGRIQNMADPNHIILGFVFPGNSSTTTILGKPINLNIGAPEMPFNELSECVKNLTRGIREFDLCKPGCELIFNAVRSAEGKKFLHFASFPGELRGLEDSSIIISTVKLSIDENQVGIRLTDGDAGSWCRSTVPLKNHPGQIKLEELVKWAPECRFTLPEEYKGEKVVIQVPKSSEKDFILKYSGTAPRPRAGIKRDKLHEVDFAIYRFCCIPLFNADINKFLLIRSNVNEKNKSLILHQISTEIEKTYNDLANFIDTAGECAEFVFD